MARAAPVSLLAGLFIVVLLGAGFYLNHELLAASARNAALEGEISWLTHRLHRATDALEEATRKRGNTVNAIPCAHAGETITQVAPWEKEDPLPPAPTGKCWIQVVMPTVPRQQRQKYLIETLESWMKQISADPLDPFFASLCITVIRNGIDPHIIFDEAKKALASHPFMKEGRLRFIHNARDDKSIYPTGNLSPTPVIMQTRDLIAATKLARGISRYVMFVEDDFLLCGHALRALHYFVNKASTYHPQWSALRVSYGHNGIVFKDEDLAGFETHLVVNTMVKAPDLLAYDFLLTLRNRGRLIVVFRYNLFTHIGVVSTLAQPKGRYTPQCFDIMGDWLQDHEMFPPYVCEHDDVFPCGGMLDINSRRWEDMEGDRVVDWDTTTARFCPRHFPWLHNPFSNETGTNEPATTD